MDYEDYYITLDDNDQKESSKCPFDIGSKCLYKLVLISGILIGFTCAAMALLRDRKHLTVHSSVLIVFLSIFIVVTVLFVVVSVLLLLAALDENLELMSYYIWLTIVYLCMQLILAICIPILLVIEGKYPPSIVLIWMVIMMIIGLGWTHFVSVINSYRMTLL